MAFSIETKGFRGEALASKAAIDQVEMRTKTTEEELGSYIQIEGSKVVNQEAAACPKGTSVAVKNLFYNVPARRNFLKSNTVELRHILDEFHRIALSHTDIAFKCYHNDNELFNLAPANLRQRIVHIFGTKTNEKLVPVEEQTEIVSLNGFIGKPEYARKTRGEQFFFVNNRYIKSPYLNHAVNAAFEGILRDGTHPSYFLYLEVDPKSIDINIHPTKTEVKFEDEHTIYAILKAAIKHSLGQFNIGPVLDFDRDANMDTPYTFKDKAARIPAVDIDQSFNPFDKDMGKATGLARRKSTKEAWEGLYVGLKSEGTASEIEIDPSVFETDEVVSSLFKAEDTIAQYKTFQIHNKYIVSSIKSGLVIIDQGRAHERILYEAFLQSVTVNEGISQQLLFPLKLNLSTIEVATLEGMKNQLEHTGFVFEKLDHEAVELSGIPVSIEEAKAQSVIEKLIHDVENQVPDDHFSQSDLIAKSLAKSMAIKTGQKLTHEEQEHLANSLFACKEPAYSPFNQKTFITLSSDELDNKFS